MGKALKRWWPLFMLPTCLAFMIGFVIPFIQGFYLSFCQFITINNTHFVGIENYVRALSDPQFATSFFFTVAFAFLSTVLINVIALAIAQALTRKALIQAHAEHIEGRQNHKNEKQIGRAHV